MNLHNGLALAYLGDAVWELRIRDYLMGKGLTKVNDLHKNAIRFTCASGEAKAMDGLLEGFLTEDEINVFKRGRNAESTRKPQSVDLGTYHKSTGFEALIGNLFLEKAFERLDEIVSRSIRYLEETEIVKGDF